MFPIKEIDTSYIKPKELSERVREILMVDGETKDKYSCTVIWL